jgi:hypothetical protein
MSKEMPEITQEWQQAKRIESNERVFSSSASTASRGKSRAVDGLVIVTTGQSDNQRRPPSRCRASGSQTAVWVVKFNLFRRNTFEVDLIFLFDSGGIALGAFH